MRELTKDKLLRVGRELRAAAKQCDVMCNEIDASIDNDGAMVTAWFEKESFEAVAAMFIKTFPQRDWRKLAARLEESADRADTGATP